MRFENTKVMNFEGALRGMRNPKNSWHKSDSYFGLINIEYDETNWETATLWASNKENNEEIFKYSEWLSNNGTLQSLEDMEEIAFIGPNDMKLAQQLILAGNEHRKFMRQIFVSVDITAPVYWWKEFDTYKVGTVANSTSSMHTLVNNPIDMWDCFEMDDFSYNITIPEIESLRSGESAEDINIGVYISKYIEMLEELRKKYKETKDVHYWKELIRWLPSSFLQKRTVTLNYENLLAICSKSQRRNHKLNEWSGIHTEVKESFIQWARSLPYAQELIFIDELDTAVLPSIDI